MTITAITPTRRAGVQRAVLGNGLRVVVAPEPGTGVVAVAVHYAVGYRSEPPGRAGFAHLFEHLMFQGSAHAAKLAHFRYVQGRGGSCNAVTARDHTCYHQVLPADALDGVLALEADRMRAPGFTGEHIANQVAVIGQEIGAAVLGRPYGGLPWLYLPPVLFDQPANTHNGYGSVAELATATVADCHSFFIRFYTPANAVLTVTGDVTPSQVFRLVERHFAVIAGRPAPARTDLDEPELTADREQVHHDPIAPLPATVAGWRLPGQAGRDRLAFALLAELLAGGEGAPLQRRLVRAGLATHVKAEASLTGELLGCRAPDAFVLTVLHASGPAGVAARAAAGVVGDELARLASAGPDPDALTRASRRLAVRRYRQLAQPGARAQTLGTFEVLHGRAELAWELAEQALDVTADAVAAAAAELARAGHAVLHVRAGQAAVR